MIKITGLNELQKKLNDLEQGVKELDGERFVPMSELLTDAFLSKHTRFSCAKEMFDNSGFKVESQEDLAAIPDDDGDEYVRSVSDFRDWESMLSVATQEWVGKKLGL